MSSIHVALLPPSSVEAVSAIMIGLRAAYAAYTGVNISLKLRQVDDDELEPQL